MQNGIGNEADENAMSPDDLFNLTFLVGFAAYYSSRSHVD